MKFVAEDEFFAKPRSRDELAEWTGCTRKFLESEVKAGRLRARRLSCRLIRFLPDDIRDWMDQSCTVYLPRQAQNLEHV
jgi:predicted DNA-binding transcriptional regulator AlpA